MATYSSFPMPSYGYPNSNYYYTTYFSTTPAPGYPSYEVPYGNSYGPPQEPYTYDYYPPPPIPRPATAFPSMRPHSSYMSEGNNNRERDARERYEADSYDSDDISSDEFRMRFSPRYNSKGQYATASINPCRKESRAGPRRMRSFSASHPIPGVDSDDETRHDEYKSTESSEGIFYQDRKAPRRPKKKSYNYRGHGYEKGHYHNSYTHTYEDEEDEQDDRQRSSRNREKSFKNSTRPSSAAPRRSHGTKSNTYHERQRQTNTHPEWQHQSNTYHEQQRQSDDYHEQQHQYDAYHEQQRQHDAYHEQKRQSNRATEEDRRKYKFPSHYCLEFWDPAEAPIILLGNVFDANSLGKWIYDWTASCYGPFSPISKMAGDLWKLLIHLTGKVQSAEECVPMTRSEDAKEMLQDFISSGERLHARLRDILEQCEKPMLRVSEMHGKTHRLGKNSGYVFVHTLFGRDRLLVKTDKFMHSIRLWNLRFDANCGDVLRSLKNDY